MTNTGLTEFTYSECLHAKSLLKIRRKPESSTIEGLENIQGTILLSCNCTDLRQLSTLTVHFGISVVNLPQIRTYYLNLLCFWREDAQVRVLDLNMVPYTSLNPNQQWQSSNKQGVDTPLCTNTLKRLLLIKTTKKSQGYKHTYHFLFIPTPEVLDTKSQSKFCVTHHLRILQVVIDPNLQKEEQDFQ